MQGTCRRVRLEVGPRTIAFEGVTAVPRNVPLQLDRTLQRRLRQVDLHAVARRLHVTDIHQLRESRTPESGERTTTGVEGEIVLAVVPPRRHHPAVLLVH